MARDYLLIPGSSCLAECAFSLSGCTDDPQHHQMTAERFSAIQRLQGAYWDGQLEPFRDAWLDAPAPIGVGAGAEE